MSGSCVEYDLDTQSTVMQQIQALVAPPGSDERTLRRRESKELHPYYKRPGKGHNHDICDACGEGGDLLCCDQCPASFHYQCHDPPLDEDDIPMGEWQCHQCKMLKKLSETNGAPPFVLQGESKKDRLVTLRREECSSDSDGSIGKRGDSRKRDAPQPVSIMGKKRRTKWSTSSSSSKSSTDDSEEVSLSTSLQTLIKAAATLNPKQFELPREIQLPTNFPGESKFPTKKSIQAYNKLYYLDNGLVPFPVKTCYECGRSVRHAPLLACDYCPLAYHLDCLDPPLTNFPAGLWMCPAHPQHFLEDNYLDGNSLVERVNLWDRYAGPINQEAIKLDFFRKVHRKNPPFRYKVKCAGREKSVVPESVFHQYQHPPPLIPRMHQMAVDEMYRTAYSITSEQKRDRETTHEEQEQWLSNLVHFQMAVARRQTLHQPDPTPTKPEDAQPTNLNDSTTSTASMHSVTSEEHGTLVNGAVNGLSESVVVNGECGGERTKGRGGGGNNMQKSTKTITTSSNSLMTNITVKKSTGKLTSTTFTFGSNSLSLPLVSKSHNANNLISYESFVSLRHKITTMMQKGTIDTDMTHMNKHVILLLAQDRIRQLEESYHDESQCQNKVRSRAVLNNLTAKGTPFNMCYRNIRIGTSKDQDLCLTDYGHCNFVSANHAELLYDEASRHYELLNFSEHGTTVDNVLYSCDFSDKPCLEPSSGQQPLVLELRKIISKRLQEKTKVVPDSGKPLRPCSCKTSNSSLIGGNGAGWEGSAAVNHGSVLKFGCLQFIFSIVSHANLTQEDTQTKPILNVFRENDGS